MIQNFKLIKHLPGTHFYILNHPNACANFYNLKINEESVKNVKDFSG
jgi:hypothetical protein